MHRLLISFCNTLPQGFPLAAFHFSTGDLEWLPTPELRLPIGGASGLCRVGDIYYALLQHRIAGAPSTLVSYGADLRVQFAARLHRVSDGHSLLWREGYLFTVSTGTNEVIRMTIDRDTGVVLEEVAWSVGDERRDRDHLNSVTFWQDKFYVSSLGPEVFDEGLMRRRDGSILAIDTQEPVQSTLLHPHTLTSHDAKLYCLESQRGKLWKFQWREGALQGEVTRELGGYLRGMTFDPPYLYVGASARRMKSKSKGTLFEAPAETPEAVHCVLYRINLQDGSMEQRDLTPFGREIYDLAPLEADCPLPSPGSSFEAIIRRQLAYDKEHLHALRDLEQMIAKYEILLRQGLEQ